MSRAPVATERLDSWKEIAAYIGRDVRTVIRWEQQRGLPVHRVPGGGRHVVFAFPNEIDAWLAGREAGQVNGNDVSAGHPSDSKVEPEIDLHVQYLAAKTLDTRAEHTALPRAHRKWVVSICIAACTAALVSITAFRIAADKRFIASGESQVTDDGAPKRHFVTDGSNLYFGEWQRGRIVLSSVPVQGGPIHEIPTPFVQSFPIDISRDRHQLLVLEAEGVEEERKLWIVPIPSGAPQRVGDVLCHSAAWSPDGKLIAFATNNTISISSDNGVTKQSLQGFVGIPDNLRWSVDGRRMLFLLRDPATWQARPWEMVLDDDDHFSVTALLPLTRATKYYGTNSPVLDGDDDFFLGGGEGYSSILVAEKSRWPWKSNFSVENFSREMANVGDLAVDTSSQTLYFMREGREHSELDWFDKKSHEFHPFLPGICAVDVDFSRDGRSSVFVMDNDKTVWVTKPDGSGARRIDTSGMMDVELPRWSPDGKQIAFMGKRQGAPWRIYVELASGANLHEASRGSDSQGAPTWSPDGRKLVYGRVECQEEKNCAIEQIDLKTGDESVVAGSEGLSTARWSPDGRYIAALRADKFQIFLLDQLASKWRKLADDVNGNDLAWAPDSKAVYASKPGSDRPDVVRVPISGGRAETVVDFTDFSKLLGRIDTWFAVTPDDSILFRHDITGNEIYALHYREE